MNNKTVSFIIGSAVLFSVFQSCKSPDQVKAAKVEQIPVRERLREPEPTRTPAPQVARAVSKPSAAVLKPAEGTPPAVTDAEQVKWLREQARNELANIRTSMQAYMAEAGRYTSDLKATGYRPVGTTINLKAGFINEFRPENYYDSVDHKEEPGQKDLDSFLNENFEGVSYRFSEDAEKVSLAEYKRFCRRDCTVSDYEFELLVAVPLGKSRVDVWIMDQYGNIRTVKDGLKAAR